MKKRLTTLAALGGAVAVAALVAAAAPGSAENMVGNCAVMGAKGSVALTPAQAGQLTVEVNLPAPGFWNGDTPETIKDGFEYCLAAEIAYRAGLDKVAVVNVAWDALVAGQTKNFDLALSQISITDERKKVVDFSVPYFDSDIGILAKKGTKVDGGMMKSLRIGVQQATTGADFVDQQIKPSTPAKVFPDTPSMFTALQAGQIDVAMTDTAIVLQQAKESNGLFEVVGQYATGEKYGALYPKGSASEAALNKAIEGLIADGTIKALALKYLGGDPSAIPIFKP